MSSSKDTNDSKLSKKLAKDMKEELDDETKLKDLEVKDKIAKLKKTEKAGIVDSKGTFDLAKFRDGVDNQGRRDILLDAMKEKDKQKENVLQAKILLESKIKKLKETIELQKRYYQLVPRPSINKVGNTYRSPLVTYKSVPEISTYKLFDEHLLISVIPRGDEKHTDISQLVGPPNSGDSLSNEAYVFVRYKPVESNLSLDLPREKFQQNLQKLKLGTDYERESEAIREYAKLNNEATLDPEEERKRKAKLMESLIVTFGDDYNKIISDYQAAIKNFIDNEDILICIKKSDLDISKYAISGFPPPTWDSPDVTGYYQNIISTLNGNSFKGGSPNKIIDCITMFRDKYNIFNSGSRPNYSDQLEILKCVGNDMGLQGPDAGKDDAETIRKIRSGGGPWNKLYNDLSKSETDTKAWMDFISKKRDELKSNFYDIKKLIDKEISKKTGSLMKPTNADKQKIAQQPCRTLMGDLYVATFYIPDGLNYYSKYVSANDPTSSGGFISFDFLTKYDSDDEFVFIVDSSPEMFKLWNKNKKKLHPLKFFYSMIKNRIQKYPGEYKLFPQDIKYLCLCIGFEWSPFIDIRKFIQYIIDNFDALSQSEFKIIYDYYDKVDPICYEYIERVLPIFSINSSYYTPRNPQALLDIVTASNILKKPRVLGISKSNVSLVNVLNDDNLQNVRLPLANNPGLKNSFYNAVRNINIPELKLTLTTFGIEGLVNIEARCQESFWNSLNKINQINYKRENTAFYYLEEKIESEKLSNDYFEKSERLAEMDKITETMNKIIDERDFSKSQKDTLSQQLELGLEAFQFWKTSEESKTEVYNILREFRISKFFAPLDKKNFATVGKFLQLTDDQLFKAVTQDFELIEQEKVILKKAISTLKERIEKTKKEVKEEKDVLKKEKEKEKSSTTPTPKQLTRQLTAAEETIAQDEEIIDIQKEEIEKDLQEIKDDEEKIKKLTQEYEDTLKRNHDLDKLLKDTQTKLNRQKSLNIEIDEYMQTQIHNLLLKYKNEYQQNIKTAEELMEIISTMKNMYTTKKNKLLISQNLQLKKSLDEARQIIVSHEQASLEDKINHKKKDLHRLQQKRTKKKLRSTLPPDSPPIYRVLTPRKK